MRVCRHHVTGEELFVRQLWELRISTLTDFSSPTTVLSKPLSVQYLRRSNQQVEPARLTLSLYGTFYKHWRRKDRNALERFITTAFVDLLRRLGEHHRELVEQLVLDVFAGAVRTTSSPSAVKSLKSVGKRLKSGGRLEWRTEEAMPVQSHKPRYPDICLYVDGLPLMVIENKITARFTTEQLQTYGQWLAAEVNGGGAALVLLTHATAPPTTFLEDESERQYGVALRSVCSWLEIWEWLGKISDLLRKDPIGDPLARELLREFYSFLGEQHMNGITKRDIAVLQTTLRGGVVHKVKPFFDMVREELKSRVPLRSSNYHFERVNDADLWDAPTGYAVYDWCYLKPKKQWYLGWGLTGSATDFFGTPHHDSDGLLAFVYIGAGSAKRTPLNGISTKYKQLLGGSKWIFFDDGSLAKEKQAAELAKDSAGFTQAFINWTAESLNLNNS
jgi:hypothetical protein